MKCISQSQSNLDGTVGVIALSHVEYSWNPVDFAEVEIVETVFAAGEGEDKGVHRSLLYEFGVIVASRMCAVTASNEENVLDMSCIDGVYDLTSCDRTALCPNPVVNI